MARRARTTRARRRPSGRGRARRRAPRAGHVEGEAQLAGVHVVEQAPSSPSPARCRAPACSPGRRRASWPTRPSRPSRRGRPAPASTNGPAMDHMKSTTFRPDSGRSEPSAPGSPRRRRRAGGPARPAPPRCARRVSATVREAAHRRRPSTWRTGPARSTDRPRPGRVDVGRRTPGPRGGGCPPRPPATEIGAISRRRSMAPSSSSAFVLRRGEGGDGGLGRLPLLHRLGPALQQDGHSSTQSLSRPASSQKPSSWTHCHEAGGERADDRAEDVRDRDVAVLGRVHEPDLDVAGAGASRRPRAPTGALTAEASTPTCVADRDQPAGGHVDVLAQPGPGPLDERHERAAGADGGAEVEGLGQGDPHRRPVGVAGDDERAGAGHERQVGRRPPRLGPVLAVRGDRHVDERQG